MPAGRAANSLRTLVEDPRIMIAPGNGVHSTGRIIYNRRRVAADNSLRTLAENLRILIAHGDGEQSVVGVTVPGGGSPLTIRYGLRWKTYAS